MSILRYLAAPLAPLYGAVVRARNRGFDAHPERAIRVSVPVVSVGNLSAGGTGKTPLTLFLAQGLEAAGWTNAVLSRGYGGRREVDPMSVEADSDPRKTGDEPLLLARRLGPHRVVVGRKRHAAALRALAQRPELRCLLLDDGFQHRALHRDLDLLVLDGVRRWGDGRLLPLGDLREPVDSVRRAHALVVSRAARVSDRTGFFSIDSLPIFSAAGASAFPPSIFSHDSLGMANQPLPLQAFLPAQALPSPAHLLWPAHLLTPWHLTVSASFIFFLSFACAAPAAATSPTSAAARMRLCPSFICCLLVCVV